MFSQTIADANPDSPFEAMMPAYERWADPVSARLAGIAIRHLGDVRGKRILDIGAGLGSLAIPLSRSGAEVVAIDNAPAMVARLRERLSPFRQSQVELRNLYNLPADKPNYDVVASIFCVALMPDARDMFARMVAMTKPGGMVCVTNWATEYGAPVFEILARALRALPVPNHAQVSPGLSQLLEAAELGKALANAGCQDVEAQTVNVKCDLPAPVEFLNELETFLRLIPAYKQLSASERAKLQVRIEKEFESIPCVGGIYSLPAPANIAIGRVFER